MIPAHGTSRDYLLDQGITSTATVKSDRMEPIGSGERQDFCLPHPAWQHTASARLLALPVAMQGMPAHSAPERRRRDHAGGDGDGRSHISDTFVARRI